MAPWKFRALRDHVQGCPVGSKILVFCNYLDEMRMAQDTLEDCVDVVMEYHGSMMETERQNVITEFMTPSPQSKVIVMQIQCGSAGLNLQSAQYVFIMSPTWNPGIERQAMARAHRSNTPHIVNVTRYVTQNTIESFMYLRQKNKDTVSNTLLRESTPHIDGTLYQLREGTSIGIECRRDTLWGSNKLFQSLDMDDIPDDENHT
jgi:SNF2 family DNA or RNA helicase